MTPRVTGATSSLYTCVMCYCATTASAYTSAGPLSLKQNGVCTFVITPGCTGCPLRTLNTTGTFELDKKIAEMGDHIVDEHEQAVNFVSSHKKSKRR